MSPINNDHHCGVWRRLGDTYIDVQLLEVKFQDPGTDLQRSLPLMLFGGSDPGVQDLQNKHNA